MTNTGNITEVLDRYIDSPDDIAGRTVRPPVSEPSTSCLSPPATTGIRLQKLQKGSIQPEYTFSADVVDEPGAISIISSILSGKGISIKNIGISHNREHGEGRAADQLLRQGFDGSGVGAFEEIQLHAVRVDCNVCFQT